jgi:hypothetical protein
MSPAALANSGILSLAVAFWVLAELVWALWPGAWKTQDEPEGATAPRRTTWPPRTPPGGGPGA